MALTRTACSRQLLALMGRARRPPGHCDRRRPLVPRRDPPDRRGALPSRRHLRSAARPAETGVGRSGSDSPTPSLVLWDSDEGRSRAARLEAGVGVTYKTVDTCAAEFAARTPYHYGTFEDEDEVAALREAGGRNWQRAEPHRPGRRVRLLLRARCVRPLGRGLRDRHGQLQPRDGLTTTTRATGSSSSRSRARMSSRSARRSPSAASSPA